MTDMVGSVARLTESATPLLLEASSNMCEFAVQRWLFASAFLEDRQQMMVELSRLAGVASVLDLTGLSEQARDLKKHLKTHEGNTRGLVVAAQRLFHWVMDDVSMIHAMAYSERARSWFAPDFLETAARIVERELYVKAISEV